jgi:hypothetical protein
VIALDRGNSTRTRQSPRSPPRGRGCSSGPLACSWRHGSAETVGAHAASKSLAKANGQRSSRCSRTSMKACGGCPRGQRGSAPRRALARDARVAFSGGRHLGLEEAGGIDVPPMEPSPGDRRTSCSGSHAASRPKREVSEGSTDGAAARLTRPQRSSLPRARAMGGSRRTRSRQRAVKRAAVGGRMTARWSGVFLDVAETPSQEDLKGERRRVFPRRSAGSLRR